MSFTSQKLNKYSANDFLIDFIKKNACNFFYFFEVFFVIKALDLTFAPNLGIVYKNDIFILQQSQINKIIFQLK